MQTEGGTQSGEARISQRKRLGEMLIERGQLQPDELDKALAFQRERPEKLGRILVELGFLSSRDVLAALSEQLQVPIVTSREFPVVAPEVEGISPRFLRQFRLLPLGIEDSIVVLAMADPLDSETIAAVRLFTGKQVSARLGSEQEILAGIERFYPETEPSAPLEDLGAPQATEDLEHLRDMASEAPVIRLVNSLIARAVERGASDIHLEPAEKEFRARYRLDEIGRAAWRGR